LPGGPTRAGIARGLALLVAAVVIGVLVLDRGFQSSSASPAGTTSSTTTTTVHSSTTTTVHPTTTTTPHSSTTSTAAGRSQHGTSASTTTTTAAATVPPAQVKALVANGTQTSGLAARVSAKLQSAGYGVLPVVNATQQVTASAVYYASGSTAAATEVASALGLTSASVHPLSSSAPVSSADGAQVVVVAGPDLASRFPASSGATTTTAAA
jgi:cytoskeletal protein RodZ